MLISESSLITSISDYGRYQPKTDLEVTSFNAERQSFHSILEALFKIFKEYCDLYLNCKQVLHAQTYTACTAIQLLQEVHGIMDAEEISEWTKVSVSAATLEMCISSISKYRKSKLEISMTVLYDFGD